MVQYCTHLQKVYNYLNIITLVYKKFTIFYLDTLYTFAITIWIYNYPKL